ncbi:hypothetical protein FACS1894181_04970 [Bacteroidia bacterium]|nr:hypothetical protein FACS1894181_04970 [Bacteroidia bacterium]
MKSFRISLRNVATSVAILAVALMSSAVSAQTEFEYTDASGVRAKYRENTSSRCPDGVNCVNLSSVISIPAGLDTWAMDGYVTHNGVTYELKEIGSGLLVDITSSGRTLIPSIKELIFPNTMTLIDLAWKYYMPNIHKVTFGKNIERTGDYTGLPIDTVIFLGKKAIQYGQLTGNLASPPSNMKVFIPCGTRNEFVAAYNKYPLYWGNMPVGNFIEMPCLNTLTVLSNDVNLGGARSYSSGSIITSTPANTSAQYSGQAELIAIPKAGNVFVGWNDGNLENPRVINVTGDVTYTAQFAACTNTAIESIPAQSSGLSVYPNPVENMLNVELNRDVRNGTLALFDLNGKAVARQNLTGRQAAINLQPLAKGMYILRLVEGGNASAGVKIVKQ